MELRNFKPHEKLKVFVKMVPVAETLLKCCSYRCIQSQGPFLPNDEVQFLGTVLQRS